MFFLLVQSPDVTGLFEGFFVSIRMYFVFLTLITACVAYQGPLSTTVTPPPLRGAARQMFGSGQLRPPGSNPAIDDIGQMMPAPRQGDSAASSPSLQQQQQPPPQNPRSVFKFQPILPLPIPYGDFASIPEGYPIFMPEYSSSRSAVRTSPRGGGMYGGRHEYYAGRPDREFGGVFRSRYYPVDMSMIPGRGFGRPEQHGVMRQKYRLMVHGMHPMHEPPDEDLADDSEREMDQNCDYVCKNGEFLCEASCTCIDNSLRCDGQMDCEKSEDEDNCDELEEIRNARCQDTERYVKCPHSGKCISKEWLCDGDDDCGDSSDETHCVAVNCTHDQFECANGFCIPKTWLCDNDNDCKDYSDEMNCTKIGCTEDEFTCSDGTCISYGWKCDHDQDCNDGSDESECDAKRPVCSSGEFQCTYQKCIKMSYRCDGDNDCGDRSDEEDCKNNSGTCSAGEFKCNSGKCIPLSWKCDRQLDCTDNEDEINCTESNQRTCSPDEYTCNSGSCILKTWVCDGFSDCDNDEDESNCVLVCDDAKFPCSIDYPNDNFTQYCINKKYVCDGQTDCPKGEDEKDCPVKHVCPKDSKCQVCQTLANGEEGCACRPGYTLNPDGVTCDDVDECMFETDPVCSQTCNNTVGSFVCGCMTGYVIRPDMRTCKALGASPTLLFANRVDIRQVSISNNKYTALLKGLLNAIALDYHYKKSLLFWSDVSLNIIRSVHMNGTDAKDVIKWGLESPGGVALDWVHDLLFWTDSGTRRVEVASLDGKQRAIIIASDLDKPRAIAVHPGEAYVFWTDWGPNPKIERVEMDGSNRKSIITEHIFWPNGLTLDYTNNRLYWADAKHNVIETSLFDGTDRKKVISKGLPHPFALTIFEDAIYWTDWHTKAISTANKVTGAGLKTIHENLHYPMDIHSYHPQRQPEYKNRCETTANNTCQHLCLPNRKSFSCVCRMSEKLNLDGRTCQKPNKLLVFARKKDLRIKHLDKDAAHFSEIIVPVEGVKSAVALAWDSKTDSIFWTDVETDTINKVHWNGSNHQVIIQFNIESPAGLAYDWLTDKLYWTDSGTAKIEVASSDGTLRAILIWEGLDKPRDIVVDPMAGFMYWSDWGENPKIERAAMDGTMRSVLISKNLTFPNGLAIDHDTGRLYWSDGGTFSIEYSNLDGTNRHTLLSGSSLPHPFGLDVFEDDVYWTDWQTLNIEKVNKHTGLNRTNVSVGISDLMDVRVFHRNRIYSKTPCHHENGGCSHLCLLKPNGHACACPIGIIPKEDGKTCNRGPINSLVIANQVDIRQISLDVPYIVDAVLPIKSFKNVVSVDSDRRTGELYWSDNVTDVIEKNRPDGQNLRTIMFEELENVMGIAVDSVGRKIYWTDSGRISIEVAELNGVYRKLLFCKDLGSPEAITLHYDRGLMFWSDSGTKRIEVANMDGTHRRRIITSKLESPHGLAIDRPAERLYWNDNKLKTIESSDLNGKDRRIILTEVPHPYGLVIVGNHMYWTDWQTQSLHSADKLSGQDSKVIRDNLKGLMDVTLVQNTKLTVENVCQGKNGGCSHLCLRNSTSYACACPTGVQLIEGSYTTCHYQPSKYLLLTTRTGLVRISLDTEDLWDITLRIRGLQSVCDLDFHWEKQLIYISDVNLGRIQSVNMRNLSDVRDIVTVNVTSPYGIAIDWIADNIYWTNEIFSIVEVAKTDGSDRKVIVRENLSTPRSIAVFPRKGFLYWTDWGSHPKIEMSYLDGSSRTVIVDKDLGYPNGLVVDYQHKRLYWTDSKFDRVETSDLHGRSRIQLVHTSDSSPTQPFSLALFEDYMYWTDWYNSRVIRADRTSGKNRVNLRRNLIGVMGITMVAKIRQKGWNPCAFSNGGCTHLCFFKLVNYTCACPDEPTTKPCKTEPKEWVSIYQPDFNLDYDDEDVEVDAIGYDSSKNSDDIYHPDRPHVGQMQNETHLLIGAIVIGCISLTMIIVFGIAFCLRSKKKYLYATGRSVMTFSNPNYYTSSTEPVGPSTNSVDKKPFLWKRLKYDKSQERVYEEKAGNSSPEVASLIPTVLTPSSSQCEAITPELERSPSITPLHRLNSMSPIA